MYCTVRVLIFVLKCLTVFAERHTARCFTMFASLSHPTARHQCPAERAVHLRSAAVQCTSRDPIRIALNAAFSASASIPAQSRAYYHEATTTIYYLLWDHRAPAIVSWVWSLICIAPQFERDPIELVQIRRLEQLLLLLVTILFTSICLRSI